MKAKIVLLSILIVASVLTGCTDMLVVPTEESGANEAATAVASRSAVLVKAQSSGTLERLVADMGSRILAEWSDLGWAQVAVPAGETTETFLTALREQETVITAEPDQLYTVHEAPEDPSSSLTLSATSPATDYDTQWGFSKIQAESAWDVTTGDPNVIVAVINTGVDTSHPEFADKTIIGMYDATGEGITDVDDHGGGTQVAGIAAANGATGDISGVAWDSPLMPVRVMNSDGMIYTTYLIESLIYVADYVQAHPQYRIAAVIGAGSREYSAALKDAVDYAFENGVFIVASAGDDASRRAVYPAAHNGVMAVAASTPADTAGDFSNSGSWISVAAPGQRILTTEVNDTYGFAGGSTIAAAHVCGAGALLLSNDSTLTPLQVMNQLEQTAQGSSYTESLGYGVIDAAAALGSLEPMQYGSLDVNTNIISTDVSGYIGVGIVTITDANGDLVAYGTTGDYGDHVFHALAPADYTVSVSYYEMFADSYELDSAQVTVTAGQQSSHDFTLNVPVEVIRESLLSQDFREPAGTSYEYPITIVQAGFYEFTTSFYTEQCDTTLRIVDVNGNPVAENDDHESVGEGYSYIGMNFNPGDYTVVIEESELLELDTSLEIVSAEAIY